MMVNQVKLRRGRKDGEKERKHFQGEHPQHEEQFMEKK